MSTNESSRSRRAALARCAQWAMGASVVALAAAPVRSQAKAAKSDFFYQDKPKEGKSCSNCRLFVPAEASNGTCAIIDGPVSASGWCMAYSPRN